MTLDQWLQRIEAIHPASIELGLDRVQAVLARLIPKPQIASHIVTVAGTNGKGSTCRVLEALARANNLSTGCYTSPHILRFTERLRLDGEESQPDQWVSAFDEVECARQGVSLTYFEYTTLAALKLISLHSPDIAILEVGLGGRLDAVNVIDPDIAVITTVDLDHQDWLGDTREKIGREKAGVMRARQPVVLGEESPPESVLAEAERLQAPVLRFQQDFTAGKEGEGLRFTVNLQKEPRSFSGLSSTRLPLSNLACALQAYVALELPIGSGSVHAALSGLSMAGRFQAIPGERALYLDVGHNRQAARFLHDQLSALRVPGQKVIALFSALADKDIEGVVTELRDQIDQWVIWGLDVPRGATLQRLQAALPSTDVICCSDANEALEVSARDSQALTVAFGSFHVVEEVMRALPPTQVEKKV